jgi:acyl-CoA hydrolase|tara:strand:+ start:1002 stop:1190 length:189 start_codon:yes stop_codon:yes gene_type:complete
MTPEDLEKVKEEVADTLYFLIDLNIVEVTAIDEDGNFCYGLTEYGREVGEELTEQGLGVEDE